MDWDLISNYCKYGNGLAQTSVFCEKCLSFVLREGQSDESKCLQ